MNWRSQCGFGIGDWGSGMSPCTHHAAQPMEPRPKAREEETGCGSAKLITYPFSLASEDGGSESYIVPTYYLRQGLRGSWSFTYAYTGY